MERWNEKLRRKAENRQIDDFIEEVIAVCKKHGFSLAHEDSHGAFEIEPFSDGHADWLRNANDNTEPSALDLKLRHLAEYEEAERIRKNLLNKIQK